jgi:carbonic anhydrase
VGSLFRARIGTYNARQTLTVPVKAASVKLRSIWRRRRATDLPAQFAALAALATVVACAPGMPFGGAKAPEAEPAGPQWTYDGASGPSHWAELQSDFALCSNGKEQSPIDIVRPKLLAADWLLPLQIKFNPSKVQMVNDGRTVQVNYERGSTLFFDKTTYGLRRFNFHSPSEHKINGVGADMEMDLVLADAANHPAMMAVLINTGAENPFFAKFWHALPEKQGQVNREITVNVADALPSNRDYYNYDGSLTAPPCTEGVSWVVLKQRIEASADQINRYRALFAGPTARPVQSLNDRLIKDESEPVGLPGSAATAPAAH